MLQSTALRERRTSRRVWDVMVRWGGMNGKTVVEESSKCRNQARRNHWEDEVVMEKLDGRRMQDLD